MTRATQPVNRRARIQTQAIWLQRLRAILPAVSSSLSYNQHLAQFLKVHYLLKNKNLLLPFGGRLQSKATCFNRAPGKFYPFSGCGLYQHLSPFFQRNVF